jgi:hypothetical protein
MMVPNETPEVWRTPVLITLGTTAGAKGDLAPGEDGIGGGLFSF